MTINGTNPPKPAKSEQPLSEHPGFVDTYADRLMDDLFTDVERVLDGGARLKDEPHKPDLVSLKSIQVPQIVLPQTDRGNLNSQDNGIDPEVQLRDATPQSSFDRLLLGAAFSSLVITLGLWVATRGGINRLFTPKPATVSTETTLSPKNQADAAFADYVGKSLTTINKNTGATANLPLLPPVPTATELPTLPVPSNTTTPLSPTAETNTLIQAMNRVAQAVEAASRETSSVMGALQRQLYQQQQANVNTPQPGGQTSGTAPISQPEVTAETPQPTESEIAEAETAAPETAEVETTAPAEAPVAAAPEPSAPLPRVILTQPLPALEIPPAPTEPTETAAAIRIDPALIHTLVGILELGERSAALFEVNGVARRIYVGESIASSGWTLVEVANQEAVIRRNGDVRTIFVGQQF